MEINFEKLNTVKTYNAGIFIAAIFGPGILFIVLYDFSIVEKLDAIKLLVLCIGSCSFLYVVDAVLFSLFVLIINKITANETESKEDEILDPGTSFGLISYSIKNAATILNLISLKYFSHVERMYWIKASIETWLLVEIIEFGVMFIIGFAAYLYTKKERPLRRALNKLKNKQNPIASGSKQN